MNLIRSFIRPARPAAVDWACNIGTGSIPERDEDNKLFNTATVYSRTGDLVAIHRKSSQAVTPTAIAQGSRFFQHPSGKVHLFDIDIPGGISTVFQLNLLTLDNLKS